MYRKDNGTQKLLNLFLFNIIWCLYDVLDIKMQEKRNVHILFKFIMKKHASNKRTLLNIVTIIMHKILKVCLKIILSLLKHFFCNIPIENYCPVLPQNHNERHIFTQIWFKLHTRVVMIHHLHTSIHWCNKKPFNDIKAKWKYWSNIDISNPHQYLMASWSLLSSKKGLFVL